MSTQVRIVSIVVFQMFWWFWIVVIVINIYYTMGLTRTTKSHIFHLIKSIIYLICFDFYQVDCPKHFSLLNVLLKVILCRLFGGCWFRFGLFGEPCWRFLAYFFNVSLELPKKVLPKMCFLCFGNVARPRGCRSSTRPLMFGAYQRLGSREAFCPPKVSQKVTV